MSAIGSALLAASVGPQGAVLGPIGALMLALGGGTAAAGGIGGERASTDMLKKSDERARRFRGGPLKMASFSAPSSAGSSGTSYNPMGSNQFALSNINRGGSGDDTPFMYGA